MTSKQLGKLRQWAGEVISTREKTQPSSEFVALEQEMETRKKGLDRLHLASRDYLEYISEKKQSDAVPGEPMMQSEALGVVMMGHGEELGDGSALGRSLISFGRARCQVAAMQSIYAVTLADAFLAYLERARAKVDDYFSQRKKLESRRLAYDAAIAKAEKTYKKDKDKREAEEELARAKARYEEMAEDVTARMDAIREGEVEYQRELKNFLSSEIKFVEQYLEALKDVDADWPEPDSYADLRRPTSSFSAPHDFSRISMRSTDSKDSSSSQVPPIPSRFSSHRSNRSVISTGSKKSASAISTDQRENEINSDDDTSRSRDSSRLSRKSSTKGSRTPSRLSKRHSRSGSVTTIGMSDGEDEPEDTESVRANGKHKKASSGVASWVGDAMSSVMSRNKSKNPDVDHFAALGDDEGDRDDTHRDVGRSKTTRRLSSRSETSNRSANEKDRSRSRTRDTSSRQRRVVKAIRDFSGSNDELSFKAGEDIVVINKVLDDWWVGETGGRRGLFPADHTMFYKTVGISHEVTMKSRNASNSSILGLGQFSKGPGKLSPEDEESRRTLVDPSESEFSTTDDEYDRESVDDRHPFDDIHGTIAPMGAGDIRSTSEVRLDNESSVEEQGFSRKLSLSLSNLNTQESPPQLSSQNNSPSKRMPPPPPPRRQTTNVVASVPPPLPVRSVAPSRIHSANTALHNLSPPTLDRRAHSDTNSPFESQSELSFDAVATTKVDTKGTTACLSCRCDEFVEDPFRGHGLCANCTHRHI